MAKSSKRIKKSREGIDRDAFYKVHDAVKILKDSASAKFDETIEISMNLNIDSAARRSAGSWGSSVAQWNR